MREFQNLLEESFVLAEGRETRAPWPDGWAPDRIIEALRPFLTEERKRRIEEVLNSRTRAVVPVVEGVINMGNVSAILRSAEAFGCLRVDIVSSRPLLKPSERASRGAHKWLELVHWPATPQCLQGLRAGGYHTVGMVLGEEAGPLPEIDFSRPTALVFGNEKEGLSREAVASIDRMVQIPMCGFTRSLNVSVAAAIALYQARQDRIRRLGRHGDLSEEEKQRLRALWYVRSAPHAPEILSKSV